MPGTRHIRYTDRVCHFAHHPGPDGHPHVCGRRSRGVNSADHLYVKSEAAAWLRSRDLQADFEFARPPGHVGTAFRPARMLRG
ncbi:hypothetical protein [Streptomyces bobili]|uniref:hypothetical protein n=1 Tax=Streptomyces bobili TaxID=67280 RepID=UPI003805D9F9